MAIFFIGILILIIITFIELNPIRFIKASPHKRTDNLSGTFITITSVLVGLLSLLDKIFNISQIRFLSNNIAMLVGIALLITGFLFRYSAIHVLGRDFNYAVAPIKKLKTNGIYKYIRHPAYLGTLLYAIGTPLLFSSFLGLFTGFFVLISIIYRITIEEKFLEKIIGSKYLKYKESTYKLIPYLY